MSRVVDLVTWLLDMHAWLKVQRGAASGVAADPRGHAAPRGATSAANQGKTERDDSVRRIAKNVMALVSRLERVRVWIRTWRTPGAEPILRFLEVIVAEMWMVQGLLTGVATQLVEQVVTGREFAAELRMSTAARAELTTALRALLEQAEGLLVDVRSAGVLAAELRELVAALRELVAAMREQQGGARPAPTVQGPANDLDAGPDDRGNKGEGP